MIIRNLSDTDKPLCPNSTSLPVSEAHQLRVRILDAFHGAADKDSEGEYTSEGVEKAYNGAAYGPVGDGMNLYRQSVLFIDGGQQVAVESWYFRCSVCGLVLPAQRMGQ